MFAGSQPRCPSNHKRAVARQITYCERCRTVCRLQPGVPNHRTVPPYLGGRTVLVGAPPRRDLTDTVITMSCTATVSPRRKHPEASCDSSSFQKKRRGAPRAFFRGWYSCGSASRTARGGVGKSCRGTAPALAYHRPGGSIAQHHQTFAAPLGLIRISQPSDSFSQRSLPLWVCCAGRLCTNRTAPGDRSS